MQLHLNGQPVRGEFCVEFVSKPAVKLRATLLDEGRANTGSASQNEPADHSFTGVDVGPDVEIRVDGPLEDVALEE